MIRTPGRPTQPDQWQVQVQAQIQLKAPVLVKTDGLSHDEVRAAHFTPIDDVSDAVRTLADAGRRRRHAVRAAAGAADHPLRLAGTEMTPTAALIATLLVIAAAFIVFWGRSDRHRQGRQRVARRRCTSASAS